jgi:hypothetical protein
MLRNLTREVPTITLIRANSLPVRFLWPIQLLRFPLSVQTVDATPTGIKLFSKVVFMKQGKRFGLSAEQKSEVWRRPIETTALIRHVACDNT